MNVKIQLITPDEKARSAMRILPLTTCVVALFLTGCIPLSRSIYKPSAEGGKLLETMCRYNSGPGIWDEIQFSRLDVEINFKVWRVDGLKDRISIELEIPEGKMVQFASSSVAIASPALREPINLVALPATGLKLPKPAVSHMKW